MSRGSIARGLQIIIVATAFSGLVAGAAAPAHASIEDDLRAVPGRLQSVVALEETVNKIEVREVYCVPPEEPNQRTELDRLYGLLESAKAQAQFAGELASKSYAFREQPRAKQYQAELQQLGPLHSKSHLLVPNIEKKIGSVFDAWLEYCGNFPEGAEDMSLPSDPLENVSIQQPNYQNVSVPDDPTKGKLCSRDEYDSQLSTIEAERRKAEENRAKAYDFSRRTYKKAKKHSPSRDDTPSRRAAYDTPADRATAKALRELHKTAEADLETWDAIIIRLKVIYEIASERKVVDCDKQESAQQSTETTGRRVSYKPQLNDNAMQNRLANVMGGNPYAGTSTPLLPAYGQEAQNLDALYTAERAVDQRQQEVLRNRALEDCDDPQTANTPSPQNHKSATTTLAETLNKEQAESVTTDEPKETENVPAQPAEDKAVEKAKDAATVPDQTATPKLDAPRAETVQTEPPTASETAEKTVNTAPMMTETVKPVIPAVPAEPVKTVIVDTPIADTVVTNPANLNNQTAATPVVVMPKEVPVVSTPIPTDKNVSANETMVEKPTNPSDIRKVDVERTPQTETVSDKFNPLNLGVGNRTDIEIVDTETTKNANPTPTRTIDLNVETLKVETAQPVTGVAKPTVATPNFGKDSTTDIGVKTQDDGPAPVKLNTNGLSKGGLQTNQLSTKTSSLSTNKDAVTRDLELRTSN